MLIDPFCERWLDRLNAAGGSVTEDARRYLLIDGVFVPGLHRLIQTALPSTHRPSLLFEQLPGCTDATRDVSPFLFPYEPSNLRMPALLGKYSGWPMVSEIEITESQGELTDRFGAWCVVKVDGQRFNFRFPDTRRLPAIFEVLTTLQRAQFAGPASLCSFIDRDGSWRELAVAGTPSAIADHPELDEQQFAKLALRVAGKANLDRASRLKWCESCLADGLSQDEVQAVMRLAQWMSQASFDGDPLHSEEPL